MKLRKSKGYEFASKLTEFVDTDKVICESNEWIFRHSGTSSESLEIVVTNNMLQLGANGPSHNMEWFEERYLAILNRFSEMFSPKMILESKAMIRGLLAIEGDSRNFLANHIMRLDGRRLNPMARPIHIVGMRFALPPYEMVESQESPIDTQRLDQKADWGLDLKIESFVNDPSKLFLEADAEWPSYVAWTKEAVNDVVGRLKTVSDYVNERLMAFLYLEPDGENGTEPE